jgi:GT2 family glycosyltransferase
VKKPSLSVAIVVPTRNRHELVESLLENLNSLDCSPSQIIIIDSSDEPAPSIMARSANNIVYRHVQIRSAAVQRNIGMLLIEKETEFVCFLDDDVIVPTDYLSTLISRMEEEKAIGISGLAINASASLRDLPKGLVGFVHRIFLLDSKREGVLLRSGINIPVRKPNQGIKYVDWLIGCSIWERNRISGLTFESNLTGQSLGEDVIFSFKASKLGILVVDSNIVINHLESPISRPTEFEFWEMWVVNRLILSKYMDNSLVNLLSYYWSTFGQFLILSISSIRNGKWKFEGPKGILSGVLKNLVSKK